MDKNYKEELYAFDNCPEISQNICVMIRETELDIKSFIKLIDQLFSPLFMAINQVLNEKKQEAVINPVFLAKTNSVATRLEEILDHYNAKNNLKWRSFRENISAVKRFTDLAYITLHLRSTSPQYKLLSGIDTFLADTDRVLDLFSSALYQIFPELIHSAEGAGLNVSAGADREIFPEIVYPSGALESNFKKSKVAEPEKVIVSLATLYLNLASESTLLKQARRLDNDEYEKAIPNVISEASVRLLESKFHNLQSIYDTNISNTDIENLDKDLKLIRGHASIVYHLLEASTGLIHYYERHVLNLPDEQKETICTPLDAKVLFYIIIDFYLHYSEEFLAGGVDLCKDVIAKYAEEGSISVKVPVYRGFHVRPSTLVAKIVQHYGSKVYLVMGSERFDASSPMNLFRVNEKINAEKRRSLARNINSLKCVSNPECTADFGDCLKKIFMELLEGNKIVNYTTDFSSLDLKRVPEESLGEYANRAIASLLAEGKIDLRTDIEVIFEGDKRVLADIEVLAECGYGEDSYGNNTILPDKLGYIRR